MKCRECGHENPSENKFCSNCGAMLEASSEAETTAIFTPPEAEVEKKEEEKSALPLGELKEEEPVLVVTKGPNRGEKFLLRKSEITVGRHPESDIFLSDITVSRNHAKIAQEPGGHVLYDVGSLNGTYLNRKRIERCVLSDGDELQIGKFKLMFLTGREKSQEG